jgi:hypothetical protein
MCVPKGRANQHNWPIILRMVDHRQFRFVSLAMEERKREIEKDFLIVFEDIYLDCKRGRGIPP